MILISIIVYMWCDVFLHVNFSMQQWHDIDSFVEIIFLACWNNFWNLRRRIIISEFEIWNLNLDLVIILI